MEILIGIICGLIFSLFLSFGPGFWGLIQNSIHYGFRKGVAFEVGVNFSDIMMVVLMLTLFNKDSITEVLRTPVASIIGGVVVVAFGVITMLRRPTTTVRNNGRFRVVLKRAPRDRELALYGFALNSLNPSVWLYWAAMTAVVKAEVHINDLHVFLFFISMLLAELAGGILKCRLASMLQKSLSVRKMGIVNKVAGGILVSLGAYLIISTVVAIHNPDAPEKMPAENATQIIHKLQNITRDTTASPDTISY